MGAKYKIDESKVFVAARLIAVLGAQFGDVFNTLDQMKNLLPRRSQRFERSIDALQHKYVLLLELFRGLSFHGELPGRDT